MRGVYRDGKVHVAKDKCPTCIFRPGNLKELSPGMKETMEHEAVNNDGAIPCHNTLATEVHSVCRGFYDVHKESGLIALADNLGLVVEDDNEH